MLFLPKLCHSLGSQAWPGHANLSESSQAEAGVEGEGQLKASLGASGLIVSLFKALPVPRGFVWPSPEQSVENRILVRVRGLCPRLCQFLLDSRRRRDHTSIMSPAGEGRLDRGHHFKIKEVIHPFTPTDGWREGWAYRLWLWSVSRGGERERGKEGGVWGEGQGELRAERMIKRLFGNRLLDPSISAFSLPLPCHWGHFHKGRFLRHTIP